MPSSNPEPKINKKVLAEQFGFALAVLNSDPELKKLFERAVAKQYTPDRFIAELRGTKWYKKNGDAWRKATIQKESDPATYKANVEQVRTRLSMVAAELGAVVSQAQLAKMAEQSYMFGWDDNQVRATMSGYIKYTDGRLLGQAGQYETELRDYAAAMGVRISNKAIRNYARSAIGGESTIDDAKSALRETAISAFPHLADRLRQGETVEQIADPYRQTMANLLELSPTEVTLNDPTVKKALQHQAPDGRVSLRTLYDFENDLRQDSRWLKTKNAQDAGMSAVQRVLSDMGVI